MTIFDLDYTVANINKGVSRGLNGWINALDSIYGITGDGVADDSEGFDAAIDACLNAGKVLWVPNGDYRLTSGLITDSRAPIIGESKRNTKFIADTEGMTVLTVDAQDESNNKDLALFGNFTIDCQSLAGTTGMVLGNQTNSNGNSSNGYKRIRIQDAGLDGLRLLDGTNIVMEQIYIEGCGRYAFYVPNERNTQVVTVINSRFRRSHTGAYLASGNRYNWIQCSFEANRNRGLYLLRQNSSGPAHSEFNKCWLEDNGGDRTSVSSGSGDDIIPAVSANEVASIYLDGNSAIQTTTNYNVVFNQCQVTGAFSGSTRVAWDLIADRAEALFDRCTFGTSASTWDNTAFKYTTGSGGAVHVLLRQCGRLNAKPTEALYASFPAPTILAGQSTRASYGIFYEFEDNGRLYTNRKIHGYNGNPIGVLTPAREWETVLDTSVTPNVPYIWNGAIWVRVEHTESGSFTPTIIGSSSAGSASYTTQVGRYYRVGKMMTLFGRIAWSDHTGTGNLQIGGLPSAVVAGGGQAYPAFILAAGIDYTDAVAQLGGRVTGGDSSISLTLHKTGAEISFQGLTASGTIDFSISYPIV